MLPMEVAAPQRPRRKHGLLSVIDGISPLETVIPLAFRSDVCVGVQTRPACDGALPAKLLPPTIAPQGGHAEFWVVAGYECKHFGNDVEEYRTRAFNALDSVFERSLEAELWASTISPNVSALPVAGSGATPILRLAAALEWISQCSYGGGIVQMSAGVATQLCCELVEVGDRLYTKALGLPVFITSAPMGTDIAITGGIDVYASDAEVIGGFEEWFSHNSNEVKVVAERMAAVTWDKECCAARFTA